MSTEVLVPSLLYCRCHLVSSLTVTSNTPRQVPAYRHLRLQVNAGFLVNKIKLGHVSSQHFDFLLSVSFHHCSTLTFRLRTTDTHPVLKLLTLLNTSLSPSPHSLSLSLSLSPSFSLSPSLPPPLSLSMKTHSHTHTYKQNQRPYNIFVFYVVMVPASKF